MTELNLTVLQLKPMKQLQSAGDFDAKPPFRRQLVQFASIDDLQWDLGKT
ncbi:MAG: hypothetical protein ABJL64_18490 [Rhizobiaceae bacterium]